MPMTRSLDTLLHTSFKQKGGLCSSSYLTDNCLVSSNLELQVLQCHLPLQTEMVYIFTSCYLQIAASPILTMNFQDTS